MPSIKVIARFRPINKTEKLEKQANGWDDDYVVPISFMDPEEDEYKNARHFDGFPRDISIKTVMMNSTPSMNTNPKFTFDRILWWDTDQEFAFDVIGKPAMEQAVEGLNCTIFAYGQSGSGKSYTTFGQEPTVENPVPPMKSMGIIPRAIDFAFLWLEQKELKKDILEVKTVLRVFEIYIHNEIKDLLFPAKKGDKKLRIRDTQKSTKIEGLKGVEVKSVADVLRQTVIAQANRTVTCTGLNAVSSRSHCIFEFQLAYKTSGGVRISSKCNFADLAGSEKVGKTGASGKALEEAKAINGSLTVLGRCIAELVKGNNPPFREAALSHCLKTSLSGNCMTTLIVAASPHRFNMVETTNSFQFASRAKMIKTKAKKNATLTPAQMRKEIKRLKGENKEMKAKLARGGHKGMAVSGPDIKVIWDGAIPEQKKERAKAEKELSNSCYETLEALEIEDLTLNVNILEKPPYTAVITFLPDEQCDVDKCKIYRDKLFEALKEDSTGPFSKHKSIEKSDPLSQQDFDQLKLHIKDLELENENLKTDGNNYRQEIIDVRKELEQAQQQLAEIKNVYDADKRKRGHMVWKQLLRKTSTASAGKSEEKESKPKSLVDKDKLRNNLLDGDDVAGLKNTGKVVRASTSRISHNMNQLRPIKEHQAGELKFTDDVKQIRKSLIESSAGRKARNEEHEKFLKQLLGQQEALARRTAMAEASKDDPNTILSLLEENKKQAQETDEVVEKLQEYYDENERLRLEAQERNAEVENLYASVQAKERQLEEMRAEIYDLEEQVKSVEAYENIAQQTLTTLRTDRKHLAPNNMLKKDDTQQSNSIWGMVRNKLSERRAGKDILHAQNALTKKNDLLKNIFSQRDYLRATTTRYIEEEEKDLDEKEPYEPMMTLFDEDFREKEVLDWTAEDVAEWLKNVRSGALEHVAERFLERSVDGELLLVLKKRELQKNYHMKKNELEIFIEELEKIVDQDEESEFSIYDDSPEDLATSMLEHEVELLENVEMPEEEFDEKYWSFSQFRENFPDIPKVIIVKVFSLLEKESSGVINIDELRRFIQVCSEEPGMTQDEDCELYTQMNDVVKQFVDFRAVFKKHAPRDGLNLHGAKNIIKKLRDCKEDDIRDDDLGVQFIIGLKYQEFNNLMRRCPQRTWQRIANFDPFELLYQEVTKSGASRVIFKKYVSAFNDIGMTYGKDEIKNFFEKMDISVTRPTPYVNTFARFVLYNLTLDDDKYEEEDVLQFIDDVYRCAEWKGADQDDDDISISSREEISDFRPLNSLNVPPQSTNPNLSAEHSVASSMNQLHAQSLSSFKPNPDVSDHRIPPQVQFSDEKQAAPKVSLVQVGAQAPMTKIVLNNQKLVSVRHRLMKFAVFGTSNMRGFEGVSDIAFKFSSFKETVNPSQACRLNTTQAKGPSAWVPDLKNPNSDNTFHVIATLGPNPKDLYAVAMQGRADKDEWVEAATILVSLDGASWKNLPTVHSFSCFDRNSVAVYPLYSPARCKYVKLRVERWHNRPSLRWDCLAV